MSDSDQSPPAAPAAGDAAAERPALPLFYQRPAVLVPERHGRAGLRAGNARFAAQAVAVPLLAEEFAAAARCYPIVFGQQVQQGALAVVGLRRGENLFVDAEGRWQPDAYAPAYTRRYPFIFLEDPAARRFALCVDEGSELFIPERAEGEGEAFFDAEGKPTETTKRALAFCEAYQRGHVATRAMIEAFGAAGILAARNADARLPSGERMVWTDFRVIDRKLLDALPDETVLDWRRRGWLEAAYAQLWSLGRWEALVAMAGRRREG